MTIIEIPQRSDKRLDYELKNRTLVLTVDDKTENFTLVEGMSKDYFWVEDDTLYIIRPYGLDEKHLFES